MPTTSGNLQMLPIKLLLVWWRSWSLAWKARVLVEDCTKSSEVFRESKWKKQDIQGCHCNKGCYFFFFFIFCWPCISKYLFININQLDELSFIISLFQASTCFEHMFSSSGGQICIIQSLVSSHWNTHFLDHSLVSVWWYQRLYNTILPSWRWARVLETYRGLK